MQRWPRVMRETSTFCQHCSIRWEQLFIIMLLNKKIGTIIGHCLSPNEDMGPLRCSSGGCRVARREASDASRGGLDSRCGAKWVGFELSCFDSFFLVGFKSPLENFLLQNACCKGGCLRGIVMAPHTLLDK